MSIGNPYETVRRVMAEADRRPEKGLWAPGYYFNKCIQCHTEFQGDKRAVMCADCAYRGVDDA